ncbi:MAG: hypothetical protein KDE35_17015 [Geminicoccaceae bacterium]|nr:hypothetical protein [Geminicoccaceae bacterium]
MDVTEQAEGETSSWFRRPGWSGPFGARRRRRLAAARLYGHIVAHARREPLYAVIGIPDTADGRRESIGLHAALAMRRLRADGRAGAALAQALFDLMFADIDRSFREQGVGDLSIGRHVKAAAATFMARAKALDEAFDRPGMARAKALDDAFDRPGMARAKALDEAFDGADPPSAADGPDAALASVLARNLRTDRDMRPLVADLRRFARLLEAQPSVSLLAGYLDLGAQID